MPYQPMTHSTAPAASAAQPAHRTGCTVRSRAVRIVGSSSVQKTTSAPAATAPADPAAATKEIKENWAKFFDPKTSAKEKLAVLENGDKMALVLKAFGGDQRGGQVQAKVTKVEFTSPTKASVTYDLTLKGATALPNASGTAVEQNGTWKV